MAILSLLKMLAFFHMSVKTVGRNQGKSIVAFAAYISGQKLHDDYYGLARDYSRRQDVRYSGIRLPKDAPSKFRNRQDLWNEVEIVEKRKDARLAREIVLAFPREFTFAEQIALLEKYTITNFVQLGMIADFAIHDNRKGNPHAHILLTTRIVGPTGFALKNRVWDKRENVALWRDQWAKSINEVFRRKGIEKRATPESYKLLGIDHFRAPMKHMGKAASALKQRGIQTDRSLYNRDVEKLNRVRELTKRREHEHGREKSR